jgi:hypothetical protein
MAAADVANIYSSNTSYFNQVKDKAFTALSRLESAALGTWDVFLTGPEYVDVGVIDKIDVNSLPTVNEVMGSIRDIVADPFPQAPGQDELTKYKTHVWESAQLDSIQSTLMDYVASMGMPDAAFQDAIFDQGKERLTRTLADQIDIIKANTSSRGFRYANGQTNALIEKLMADNHDAKIDQSRKIEELMTAWAKDNLQFSIQQGVAVEAAHMDFAYKYSSIFREIYTTLITSILEKYRTQVQMEITKVEAIVKAAMMRADVLKANADITATEKKLQMEKNQLELQEAIAKYNGNIQIESSKASNAIRGASTQAHTAGAMVQAVSNSVIGIAK